MRLKHNQSDQRPLRAWLLGWLRPFYWFYWRPSGWQTWVAALDERLEPTFNLMRLERAHWRQPRLRRLFVDAFLIGPAVTALLVAIGLGEQAAGIGIGFGLVMGLFVAVGFAILISVAAGVIAAPVGTAVFAIILGPQTTLTIDLLWQPRLGLALGACTAVAVSILIDPQPALVAFSRLRRLGSILVGIIISAAILALAAGVSYAIAILWQQGQLNVITTILFIGVAPLAIFAIASGVSSHSWRRGLAGGMTVVLLVILLTLIFFRNVDLGRDISGRSLLHLNSVLVTTGYLMIVSLPFAIALRFGGDWAARVAAAIGSLAIHAAFATVFAWYDLWLNLGVHLGIALLGLTISWWRPLLTYPLQLSWSMLLPRWETRRIRPERSLLHYQAVYWDAYQFLPLVGLFDHLLLVAQQFPQELDSAFNLITQSRQRELARAAQIELDARQLEALPDLTAIADGRRLLSATLPTDPAGALLRSFRYVSLDVAAALNQRSAYNQRLALSVVADRLNGLVRELTRSPEPYALRFRPIAHHWHEILAAQVEILTTAVAQRQEIEDPYIIGIPLTARQEIFVGRAAISQRIEHLLHDRRHPPLLIYGQRRMGKTSLLNNLGRLLPQHIIPLFVDLQGPVAFATDHAGLIYNLTRGMQRSAYDQRDTLLPDLPRASIAADPATAFDVWLDGVEKQIIKERDGQILLMLDEFEALDEALQSGRFSEGFVLGTLRHIIQHRQRIKVLLAGSHTLDEFRRWSSYLLNAEVLHLGCLEEAEALQLIEQPIPNFRLRYDPDAVQRVYTLTSGHPFLLQLLCSEIVAIKNSHPPDKRFVATVVDVETAVPSALERGSLFFADIEINQLQPPAMQLLRMLSRRGEGKVIPFDLAHQLARASSPQNNAVQNLLLRELLRETPDGYQVHNELLRRWVLTL
jgi:hypothetical protein